MPLNVIFVLLPLTIYLWTGYGRIYRSHAVFTRRWPNLAEMNTALLLQPDINPGRKGIIKRFKYIVWAYYGLLAVALAGCAALFFI